MNREIKFRAWDKELFVMRSDGTFSLSFCLSRPDIAVIMQYTGLKDKNGKEIYEGDIVTCMGGYDWPEGESGCECPGRVLFENGQWRVECVNGCGSEELYGFDLNEVIGNIYENPELLQ